MKRFFILFAALFLLSTVLAACNPHASTLSDTTAESAEAAAPIETLDIVKAGVANYRIVRAENAEQTVIDAAIRIRDQIRLKTGAKPELATDWVKRGTEPDHTTLEILVGQTIYDESVLALEGISYGDYIITRIENKLVINAWSESGLIAAVTAFNQTVADHAVEGCFSLPGDLRLTGTILKIVNALPVYEGGTFHSIYLAGDSSQLLLFNDTDSTEFAAYRQALEGTGFALYTEKTIADNVFATYTSEEYVVNAGYYAYENAARIIIESHTALPPLAAENRYEKRVEPSFAMLGLEHMLNGTRQQNGQCFIYQLADGSYIIVDGGFNSARDAKAIYDYLRDHAPDPKAITIAAWFITHAHADHHGAYARFSQDYADKVKLDYVIGNFPSSEARLAGGLGTEDAGPKLIAYTSRFAGAKFLRAHTGYVFHLRDATVEILYTLESFAPKVIDYYNTCSLVFTVDIAGQRFLVTGDASNDSLGIVNAMFGDTLKSDFVQAAHHGGDTGAGGVKHASANVAKTYTIAAAPVVLWPLGDEAFTARGTLRPASATLYDLPTTKEIFVAGSRDVRFMLPYVYGTSGCPSILK